MQELINFFKKHVELSEDEIAFMQELIPIREVRKNTLLLEEGSVSKEFYFILTGGVRLFYLNDVIEKTAFFYFEDQFVSSYESFTKQIPAKHNLQIFEDSTLAVISTEAAFKLVQTFPKFELLARIMMEEELIIYQEIISSFITMNAEQRYLSLLDANPLILQRIPQHQLATYLGVSAETLSRIRKRITTKPIS